MDTKRTVFPSRGLPYLLVAPQLIITLLFFIWPAGQAVKSSFEREDPFGLATSFVGLSHYLRLFQEPAYLASIGRTAVFALAVVIGLGKGMLASAEIVLQFVALLVALVAIALLLREWFEQWTTEIVVTSKRVGQWIFYKRNEETIAAFLQQLTQDL